MNTLFLIVLVLMVLLLGVQVLNLYSMHGADAMSRSMSQSIGILLSGGIYLLLAVLLGLARWRTPFPPFANWAAPLLLVVSLVGMLTATKLMRLTADYRSLSWLVALPPLLLAVYATMLWFEPLRTKAASPEQLKTWAALLVLVCLVPWLYQAHHTRAMARREAAAKVQQQSEAESRRARFAQLNADSPLADWLPFADWGSDLRQQALAGIRQSPRRQSDAESMLAAGQGVILEMLPWLDLQPTPALYQAAERYLCDYIKTFPGPQENPSSLPLGIHRLEKYQPALRWFSQRQGDIAAVLDCMEAFAGRHPDTPERAEFLADIAKLRQGQGLP